MVLSLLLGCGLCAVVAWLTVGDEWTWVGCWKLLCRMSCGMYLCQLLYKAFAQCPAELPKCVRGLPCSHWMVNISAGSACSLLSDVSSSQATRRWLASHAAWLLMDLDCFITTELQSTCCTELETSSLHGNRSITKEELGQRFFCMWKDL